MHLDIPKHPPKMDMSIWKTWGAPNIPKYVPMSTSPTHSTGMKQLTWIPPNTPKDVPMSFLPHLGTWLRVGVWGSTHLPPGGLGTGQGPSAEPEVPLLEGETGQQCHPLLWARVQGTLLDGGRGLGMSLWRWHLAHCREGGCGVTPNATRARGCSWQHLGDATDPASAMSPPCPLSPLTLGALHGDQGIQEGSDTGDTGQEDGVQWGHPGLLALPQLQPQVPDGLQGLAHAGKGSHCCVPSGTTPCTPLAVSLDPKSSGVVWEKEKQSSWRGDGTQILPLCCAWLVVACGDRQDWPQGAQEGASPWCVAQE